MVSSVMKMAKNVFPPKHCPLECNKQNFETVVVSDVATDPETAEEFVASGQRDSVSVVKFRYRTGLLTITRVHISLSYFANNKNVSTAENFTPNDTKKIKTDSAFSTNIKNSKTLFFSDF